MPDYSPTSQTGLVNSMRDTTSDKSLLPPRKRFLWWWGVGDTLFALISCFIIGFMLGLAFQPAVIQLINKIDPILP